MTTDFPGVEITKVAEDTYRNDDELQREMASSDAYYEAKVLHRIRPAEERTR